VAAQEVREGNVPVCDATTFDAWKALRENTVGVHGSDPHPHLLPSALVQEGCDGPVDFSEEQDGRARDGLHFWVMASACKQTLCGVPRNYEPNIKGSFFSGEYDLNNNVYPDKAFREEIEKHECFAEESQGLAVEGSVLCFERPAKGGWLMHVEITPPAGPLRRDLMRQWNDRLVYRHWRKSLGGRTMCVYGPFVADTGHGAKAEIHPTQLFWWNLNQGGSNGRRDLFAPDGPFDLFLVQDGSARYSKEHQYVINREFPEARAWRPWAQAPLSGTFEIAFSSAEGGPQPLFRVLPWEPLLPEGIGQGPAAGQASPRVGAAPRSASALRNRGTPSLPAPVVTVPRGGRDKLEVRAEWLCRCPPEVCRDGLGSSAARYLGRLVISGTVGLDRDWEEGAFGLRVEDDRLPLAQALAKPGDRGAAAAAAVLEGSRPDPDAGADLPLEPPDSEPKELKGQVRWFVRGDDEERGEPAKPEHVRALFRAAEWPEEAPHPPVNELTSPRSIRLEARGRLAGFKERDREKAKIDVRWGRIEACALNEVGPPGPCLDASGRLSGSGGLRSLSLPFDDTGRPQEIRVEVSLQARNLPSGEGAPADQTFENAVRTDRKLWTHALVVSPQDAETWVDAVRALCPHDSGGTPGEGGRLKALRTFVQRTVARKRISVTALAEMVAGVRRACGSPRGE